jgi:hypothetical protein
MGRQWLHAKRAIVNLKKGQTVGKLVKEIAVAAKKMAAALFLFCIRPPCLLAQAKMNPSVLR